MDKNVQQEREDIVRKVIEERARVDKAIRLARQNMSLNLQRERDEMDEKVKHERASMDRKVIEEHARVDKAIRQDRENMSLNLQRERDEMDEKVKHERASMDRTLKHQHEEMDRALQEERNNMDRMQAGTARVWSRSAPSAARILPDEIVESEILVRLPAKELLRCRAVCRSWRCLTSTINFLRAHHKRQPSLPLVAFKGNARNKQCYIDKVLDTFDHRLVPSERRRPVVGFRDLKNGGRVVLQASCDGLILLSSSSCGFRICNPATRQWVWLPALHDRVHVEGLYPHGSSGEYRILYREQQKFEGEYRILHYVLVVGSSEEPRCIKELAVASVCMYPSSSRPPVFLHSCLHWVQDGNRQLIVFDTVNESFRSMGSPVGDDSNPYLHKMEGMLRISSIESAMLKVWVLDYEKMIWSPKYNTTFQNPGRSIVNSYRSYAVVSEKGDTLFFCSYPARIIHCNNEGKGMEEFRWESCSPENTEHLFKESLILHAFFPERDSGEEEPYFLRGLEKRNLLLN